MRFTDKLLSNLYRAFDKEPERFLALRINYIWDMEWTISDGFLFTKVSPFPVSAEDADLIQDTLEALLQYIEENGIQISPASVPELEIDLSQYTLGTLVSYISSQFGYTIPYWNTEYAHRSATFLIEGNNNQAASNGDHLYAYSSPLWVFLEGYAIQLRDAVIAIREMLKQMVIWTAQQEWIDEWGNRFGVRRLSSEQDLAYQNRIIEEVLQIKSSNFALERIIYKAFGVLVDVVDIDSRGDNLLITNNKNTVINSPDWVCGPEYQSTKQQNLEDTFGFASFSAGRFPYGGFPLYTPQGGVTPIELTSAFGVIFHTDDILSNVALFQNIVNIVFKYRAAGTLPIYFVRAGDLLHTNTVGHITNSALFVCGPRVGSYQEITPALLQSGLLPVPGEPPPAAPPPEPPPPEQGIQFPESSQNIAYEYGFASASAEQPGNPVGNIIDGVSSDDGNRWSADVIGLNHSVEIDFGSISEVQAFRVWTYQNRAYQFYVEEKDEGGNYSVISDLTNNQASPPIDYIFPQPINTQIVRFTFTGAYNYSGSWVSIREIEVRGISTGPPPEPPPPPVTEFPEESENIAFTYGTIVGSSGYDGANIPQNLINSNNQSDADRWSVSGLPTVQWVEIDLGGVNSTVEAFRLWTYQNRDYQFYIEAKQTGGSYTTVADLTANTLTQQIDYFFETPISARFIKLNVVGAESYSGAWVSLREFEVRGSSTGTPVNNTQGYSMAAIPGGMHTQAQINTAATAINASTQPWASAWTSLQSYANARLNETPSAVQTYRVPAFYGNESASIAATSIMENDANAAFAAASVYVINVARTGTVPSNDQYANKALELVLNWATVNTSIPTEDVDNTTLIVSITAPGFIYAAEMIWGYPGFTAGQKAAALNWFSGPVRGASDARKFRSHIYEKPDGTYALESWVNPSYVSNHNSWGICCSFAIDHIMQDAVRLEKDKNLLKFLIDHMIRSDGSMPIEINRGELGINYTAFSLEPLTAAAEILRNSGGENLYNWVGPGGGSLKKALTYLFDKGIENPNLWPVASARTSSANSAHTHELFAAMGRVYGISKWTNWANPATPDLGTGIGWPLPKLLQPVP